MKRVRSSITPGSIGRKYKIPSEGTAVVDLIDLGDEIFFRGWPAAKKAVFPVLPGPA